MRKIRLEVKVTKIRGIEHYYLYVDGKTSETVSSVFQKQADEIYLRVKNAFELAGFEVI